MKVFTSESQKIGEIGEIIAQKYLVKQGFHVLERNYTKKIGEIDIVCTKDSLIHFVEIKTIVKRNNTVSRGTLNLDEAYNPFDNITKYKLRKFSRTVEWYLAEKRVSRETRWQIDAIAVILNYETRMAKIEVLWNVIVG
jgi:putative endonuclease